MSEKPLKLFDQRIIDRSLSKGLISDSEKENFLKTLPDDSDNLDEVSFEDLDNFTLPELTEEQELSSSDIYDTFDNTIETHGFESPSQDSLPSEFGSSLGDSFSSDSNDDDL